MRKSVLAVLAALMLLAAVAALTTPADAAGGPDRPRPKPTPTGSSPAPTPTPTPTPTSGGGTPPATGGAGLHYAANGNWDNSGNYLPAAANFNLADVGSTGDLANLPAGTKGLVWLGLCGGGTSAFTQAVTPFIGDSRVFGYYLMDEPDPTGQWKPQCPQADIKAESDWIHAHDPGHVTYLLLMNMASETSPSFTPTYTPANSDVDLYGLDPYPCRTELGGCDLNEIDQTVAAAESAGIPQAQLVPTYQAFGYGNWVDDAGGQYALPTPDQEQQIIDRWATLLPSPAFDYAYSWGVQNKDDALATEPTLQSVFAAHNTQ